MTHYLVNFMVYILAMVGVVFTAFLVWKNATNLKTKMTKSSMTIEDSLSLAPRKSLYIIRIENERFLIASDADKTTLLAKLEGNSKESFKDIQNLLKTQDKNNEITSQIKLKEEEQEISEEAKPVNILKELLKQKGIN